MTTPERLHSIRAAAVTRSVWAPKLGLAALSLLTAGCTTLDLLPLQRPLTTPVRQALEEAAAAPAASASAATRVLTPVAATPTEEVVALSTPGRSERRFSVVLNAATPELVFMTVLAETPLSVAVDPGIKGPMSISLKDVTLREALELLRELHGLEYKVIGRHILVSPAQMQTRIFTVDYPSFNRSGRSDLRVVSGSITGSGGGGGGGISSGSTNAAGGSNGNAQPSAASSGGGPESTRVTTTQRNDLWAEIETSLKLLVPDKDGRSVVVSPQTGSIVVRAMPKDMRTVQDYLDSTRLHVERQVMLEAKIVEVQLSDSTRTGINWGAFKIGGTRASGGSLAPGGQLAPVGSIAGGLLDVVPGAALNAAATNAGSLLGLAIQTSNFASVLEFLGTQGNTQVLSSPRIATLNNQKAVLKVGTDDFFVTNISTTTSSVGNSSTSSPNISVQPFFSGISLDVTPSINAEGYITLHVHPAVSTVVERNKILNLGTLGTYSLPLASSDINESDAVVRARNGQIIAIGGLMRQAAVNTDSGLPGAEGTPWRKLLGGQTQRLIEKRELVILLKPTIIDASQDDGASRRDSLQRLLDWTDNQRPR